MIKRSSPLHFANAAFRRLAFYYAAPARQCHLCNAAHSCRCHRQLQLDAILQNAKVYFVDKPKVGNKHQSKFERMLGMRYSCPKFM